MGDPVGYANRTLGGQVNDWVVCAKRNADAVLELARTAEAESARHEAVEVEWRAEVAAARRREQAARLDAARAAADAAAANARAETAEARWQHLVSVSRDLASRITRLPDQRIEFARGSGGVVAKYLKEVADA